MSASATPWSVKGIDPKAREVAKDLARRSGMTLGEWLNTMIMDDEDEAPRRQSYAHDRRPPSRGYQETLADDQIWMRLGASVDAIANRLEASEQRSTTAIQGVDQAVSSLLTRIDAEEGSGRAVARRVDDIAEELKEGHRRLRQFETDTAPRTVEAIQKVEGAVGGFASRLYDIEERQRTGAQELRQRLDQVEKSGGGADLLTQVSQRLDQAQARTSDALRDLERSFAGLDQRLKATETRVEPEGLRTEARFEKLAETLSRQVETNRQDMLRKLEVAETDGRIDRIERTLSELNEQLKRSEERSAAAVEAMGREILRIAQNVDRRIDTVETGAGPDVARLTESLDMVNRRLDGESARLERKIEQAAETAATANARALEHLGGEITRISNTLGERIAATEQRSTEALDDIGRRLGETAARADHVYERASSEFGERMRQSEARTAELIAEAREKLAPRAEAAADDGWAIAPFPDAFAASFPDSIPAPEPSPFAKSPAFDEPVFEPRAETLGGWSADFEVAPTAEAEIETDLIEATPETVVEADEISAADDLAADDMFVADEIEAPVAEEVREPFTPTPPFSFEPRAVAEAAPVARMTASASPFGSDYSADFGGADVSDVFAASEIDNEIEPVKIRPDFGEVAALRAAAAAGRAEATRETLNAARRAISDAERTAVDTRTLRRTGKSRLQQRLDRQGDGTIKKALGASLIAATVTAGGVFAFSELTGANLGLPTFGQAADPIIALAAADAPATGSVTAPIDVAKGAGLYQQALEALDGGDAKGADLLRQAAATGYAPAQLHLAGLLQEGGKGLAADPVEARTWAKRAADAGDARGMHAYGMYLFDGVGGTQDRDEALRWLTQAASRGLIDSQFNVAKLYETGDQGIRPDQKQAYKWYLIAARSGDTDAQEAVERLRGELSATTRGEARAEADRFKVEGAS